MPAKSKAQYRLMKAAENNKTFAKKIGIKSEATKEYTKENKGNRSFSKLKERLGKK